MILLYVLMPLFVCPICWRIMKHVHSSVRKNAKFFSRPEQKWYVISVNIKKDFTYLTVRSCGIDRHECTLAFQRIHPSIGVLKQLNHFDVVRFRFTDMFVHLSLYNATSYLILEKEDKMSLPLK